MAELITSFFSSLLPGVGHVTASDDGSPLIYHESQEAALCGQHCLNNLLQGPMFTEVDLAEIAQELDAQERALMMAEGTDTADAIRFAAEESGNVDESGNFSISVLNTALERSFACTLESVAAGGSSVLENPAAEQAFVCNLDSHWFCIRKLYGKWLDLNSLHKKPQEVSEFYLAAFLAQLQNDGYSIFLVKGPLPQPPFDPSQGNPRHWHSLASLSAQASAKTTSTKPAGGRHVKPRTADWQHGGTAHGSEDDDLAMAIAASLQQAAPAPAPIVVDDDDDGVEPGGHGNDDDDDLAVAIAMSLTSQGGHVATPAPAPTATTVVAATPAVQTSSSSTAAAAAVTNLASLSDEPPADTPDCAHIKVRLPPGTDASKLAQVVPAHTRRFRSTDPASAVFDWVEHLLCACAHPPPTPSSFSLAAPMSGGLGMTRDAMAGKSVQECGWAPNIALTAKFPSP